LQRVRLLEAGRAHRLRHESDLGGDDQTVARPEEHAQHDEDDQRRPSREHGRGRRRLSRPLQERRAHEHLVPRHAVRENAAEQQHRRVCALPGGEHDAEVGRAPDVENGKGKRDARNRVAQ
jgi:hypothetical protein